MTQPMLPYTGPTADNLACMPDALTQRPQWVLWRGIEILNEQTGELKLTKIPYDPQTLHKASTTDPATWGTFAYCVAALPVALEGWEQESPDAYRGGGLGYVFTDEDPFTGIDFDHCVDPVTGQVEDWAQAHVDALASYTEITPSHTGLHTIVEGTLPPHGRKKGQVEMYSYARFFTMTGWHLPETPTGVEARQDALSALHLAVFGPPQAPQIQAEQVSITLDDTALLAKARAATNNAKFTRLWDGDTSMHAGDDSAADMALCDQLAFWTQDPAQIDRLFRLSGLMRKKWDAKHGEDTYGARTVAEALAWQTEHYTGGQAAGRDAAQRRNGETSGAPGKEPSLPLSDYTNALAFVRDHRQDVRYLEAWGKWLHWTGTHWCYEVQGPIMQKAKATIKGLLRRAADLDAKALDAWMKHIKTSLSAGKLKAMVETAQDEPEVVIRLGALNTHPWLLPCSNGTIDLKTGTRQDAKRDDFLTECLAVAYEPTATCPTWEGFLWTIMGGPSPLSDDAEAMQGAELTAYVAAQARAQSFCDFLQRVLGQCLTGDVSEQDLYIFYGTGANGKSTLLNTIMALLGAYAMKGTAELLMTTRTDRHPTERADLYGKRLVATIETQEAGRLNETFIKEATGGDPIRARRMREDFWEFLPSHTMILATNHKPEIRGTDYAIWRRIKLIPFTVVIPGDQQDKSLPEQLLSELPGILAWMVRGCLDWQKDGLRPPQEVLLATEAYKQEQDVFEAFLATECFRTPTARVSAGHLYTAYERWCTDNDIEPVKKRAFGIRLGDSGCKPDQGAGGRRDWVGIGLPTTAVEDTRYGK